MPEMDGVRRLAVGEVCPCQINGIAIVRIDSNRKVRSDAFLTEKALVLPRYGYARNDADAGEVVAGVDECRVRTPTRSPVRTGKSVADPVLPGGSRMLRSGRSKTWRFVIS
jgi:hypothetical protein